MVVGFEILGTYSQLKYGLSCAEATSGLSGGSIDLLGTSALSKGLASSNRGACVSIDYAPGWHTSEQGGEVDFVLSMTS